MIAIVDYGLGNVAAFVNIYKRLNHSVEVAKTAEELQGARKIVLPGVGSFDQAMERFSRSGMREALEEIVRAGETPLLGVCVGMQMLAETSEEGSLPGLSWIPGKVLKFTSATPEQVRPLALPHMGWNDVNPLKPSPLFLGLESGAQFYFLHSFYYRPHDAEHVLAQTEYGVSFSSAITSGNLYGVQFHPEKSHQSGVRLLQNFASL